MAKALFALVAAVGFVGALAAGPIDLDIAANLEAVQRERPEHYAKIQKILAEAPLRAWNARSFAQWMQIDFDASAVGSSDLVLTSLPPKKRLEFTLDKTSYTKLITLQSNAVVTPVAPGQKLEGRALVQAYTNAARAGDCKSALRLGEIYRNGESGVARDGAEAAKWFNAARVLGCEVPPR